MKIRWRILRSWMPSWHIWRWMRVRPIRRRPTPKQRQLEKLKRQSGELMGRWDDLQRRDLAASRS